MGRVKIAILVLACAFLGISCSIKDNDNYILAMEDLNYEIKYVNAFMRDEPSMKKADWANHGFFGCDFCEDNISFKKGVMTLKLTEAADDSRYEYKYSGAEYRTTATYGYGLYNVTMQPVANPGVVSSFFIYTKEDDGSNWDEIDIEFLGQDTTKVQFNFYSDGVGNHEYIYNLGFDASDRMHEYGFYWSEDKIVWFVDGQGVYEVTNEHYNLPDTEGRIMMNLWNGINSEKTIKWIGEYDGEVPLKARYKEFFYAHVDS